MEHPPVVLLHGTGSTFAHNWAAAGWPDLLADAGRTVLEASLPGHGPMTGRADEDGADQLIEQLADQCPDGQPVDAIGFSAGGVAVLTAAAERPAAFRRLVIIGVGDGALGLGESGGQASRELPEVGRLADRIEHGAPAEDRVGQVFHRMVESAGNTPAAVATFLRTSQRRPSRAALAAMPQPTLILLGSNDFAAPADVLAATIPQARVKSIRGVDHFGSTADFGCIDAALVFLDS